MQWTDLETFLSMGGRGFYVWASFGVCALVVAIEPLLLRQRRSNALRLIRREKSAARFMAESNQTSRS